MKSLLAFFFILAALAVRVPAQLAGQKTAPTNPSAVVDAEWASVKDLGRGKAAGPSTKADLVRDADRLKDFYTKHPTHAEAKNAKCLEGLALIRAWLAGDVTQKARRERVVEEVRRDKSVAVQRRAELFALADHVEIGKRTGLTREGRLLAYEKAVRRLIAEFPELPNGYESLVRIAQDSGESKAVALAAEVVQMAAAPNAVKAEANGVLARFSLIGQSLPVLVRPIVGPNHSLTTAGAKPLFIYGWAASSPMSIMRAKAMAAKVPAGSVIVGVCLDDRDLDASRARATAERLPGEQVYHAAGRRAPLARALELTEPGLIYGAEATGKIRSVSVQNSLAAPLVTAGW